MSERLKQSGNKKDSMTERGAKLYRDFNLIVGSIALGGAAILSPLAIPLGAYAGLNFLQAGGGEAVRRYAKKRRLKK